MQENELMISEFMEIELAVFKINGLVKNIAAIIPVSQYEYFRQQIYWS